MQVFTKQIGINGRWYSGFTYRGYDYSESGKTVREAQQKIMAKAKQIGAYGFGELLFNEPVEYVPSKKTSRNNYNNFRPKIDHL